MVIVYLAFKRCAVQDGWLPQFEAATFQPEKISKFHNEQEARVIIELLRDEEETIQLTFELNSTIYIKDNVLIFDHDKCKTDLGLDSFRK